MTITVGRCSVSSDPLVGTLRMDGDRMSFAFLVIGAAQAGTAVDDMKAKIQQLRGLVDNEDEDVFPLTISSDSTFDGFYDSFQVTVTDTGATHNGVCHVAVSCRRIAGSSSALFENTFTKTTITNSHSLPTVSGAGRVGIPGTGPFDVGQFFDIGDGSNGSDEWATSGTNLTTDDGVVRVTTPQPGSPMRWSWSTPPALFYEASAKFEQSFGGTYYPLAGQQSLKSSVAWRLSNGLVRVSLSSTKIQVAHYDGSAWDTAKEWALGGTNGSGSTAPLLAAVTSVRVLTNTPQKVIVKCGLTMDAAQSSNSITITLRRGCRWAAFDFRGSRADLIPTWYITNAEAGSALTGGFKATSTDASGNKYVVGSPQSQTNSLAAGTLKRADYDISGSGFQFVIGSEVGADGTGQNVIDQYINSISENQRVIAR